MCVAQEMAFYYGKACVFCLLKTLTLISKSKLLCAFNFQTAMTTSHGINSFVSSTLNGASSQPLEHSLGLVAWVV
jgi:hypothetical protein